MPAPAATPNAELPPAKTYLGPLLNLVGVLRQRLTAEQWDRATALATKTVELAHRSVERLLSIEDATEAMRTSSPYSSFVTALQRWSRSADGRTVLTMVAEKLRRAEGSEPWVARDVARLARGEAMSQQLRALAKVRALPVGDDLWRKATSAVAARGLLVLCHCSFNVAFRRAARSTSVRRAALALPRSAAVAHSRFQRLEADLRAAAASGKGERIRRVLRRAIQAYSRQLPLLAAAIAPAAYLARVSRNREATDELNPRLGRAALEATHTLREGIAGYCACVELLTRADRGRILDAMAALPAGTSRAKPDVLSDRGRAIVPGAAGLRTGRKVVVEGYVAGTTTWRDSDGKLRSLVQLLSPAGDERINAVCLYVHLEHRGVVPGAYCRVAGTFRRKSKSAKGMAAVEIDRWDQKQERRAASWHARFLALAEPYVPVFPGGTMVAWALGPQRVSLKKGGKDFWGAGETVWAPVARGWSKEYER